MLPVRRDLSSRITPTDKAYNVSRSVSLLSHVYKVGKKQQQRSLQCLFCCFKWKKHTKKPWFLWLLSIFLGLEVFIYFGKRITWLADFSSDQATPAVVDSLAFYTVCLCKFFSEFHMARVDEDILKHIQVILETIQV